MLQHLGATAKRAQRQRGQAMVETTMVFLSAVILLSGMFDLGRAFYYHIAVANAVREGARLAVDTSRTNTEIQAAVTDAAPSIALINITVSPNTRASSSSGQTVIVSATHNFTVLTPVISSVLGNPFAITRSAHIMMF